MKTERGVTRLKGESSRIDMRRLVQEKLGEW